VAAWAQCEAAARVACTRRVAISYLVAVRVLLRHRHRALLVERAVEELDARLPAFGDDAGRHAVVDDHEEAHLAARAVPLARHVRAPRLAALKPVVGGV